MPKLLIVDSNADMRQALEQSIPPNSEIMFAPDGFYTLTLLERDPPDAILTRPHLQDMSGWELCSIIRRDSAFNNIRIGLLAEHSATPPNEPQRALFDEVIVDSTGSFLLDHAQALDTVTFEGLVALSRQTPLLERSPETGPVTLPIDESAPKRELDAPTLPDLLRVLVNKQKTGRLIVRTLFGQGFVVFDNGQVIHASLEALRGRTALAALCYGAGKIKASSFEFESLERDMMKWPRTIEIPANELLAGLKRDLEKNNTLELELPIRPEGM